jgi:hypothetical protein
MSFLSRLFGARKTTSSPAVAATLVTNAKSPFRIVAPSIGFLNLRGVAGNEELEKDKNVLEGLFGKTVVAIDVIPRCDVLFVYCNFDVAGTIVGHKKSLREIIRDARAYIVVVASENDPKTYMKCTGDRKVWPADIILTIERKGDGLANFASKLFRKMFDGKSLLTAWVELVPQIPGYDDPSAPATIMAAEAGHLIF